MKQVEDVLEGIYAAILDDSLWPEVLEDIASRFEDRPISILRADFRKERVDFIHTANIDHRYAERHLDDFTHPSKNAADVMRALEPAPCVAIRWYEVVPDDVMRAHPAIQELCEPSGILPDWACALTNRDPDLTAFGFHRRFDQRPMDRDDIRSIQPLLGHLAGAASMMSRLKQLATKVSTFTGVVEAIGDAIFLVNGRGLLRYASPAAEKLVREDPALRVSFGRLTATHPRIDAKLMTLVQEATAEPCPGPGGEIPLGRNVLEVSPLPGQEVSAIGERQAVLIIRAGKNTPDRRLDQLARSQALSSRQSAVAKHLVEGLTYAEIGEQLGCSTHSVKTHVRRLYDKLNCRDRAELLRIVAGIAPRE